MGASSELTGKGATEFRTAITVRLRPDLRRRLNLLRRVLKRPVNKMINEALEGFVLKRTAEVQADLKDLLAQIEDYKRHDPKFDKAFRRWEEAEASFGHQDPAEGVRVMTKAGKKPAMAAEIGSTQNVVREILNR